MRLTPGKSWGHLCWGPLIFKKNFFDLRLSDPSVSVTTLPIHHLQVSCFSASDGDGSSSGVDEQIVENYVKILFYLNS